MMEDTRDTVQYCLEMRLFIFQKDAGPVRIVLYSAFVRGGSCAVQSKYFMSYQALSILG
jgi:hypothetical protein